MELTVTMELVESIRVKIFRCIGIGNEIRKRGSTMTQGLETLVSGSFEMRRSGTHPGLDG